jgi:ATP-binding cassette, subfamily B, bacterial MsbA
MKEYIRLIKFVRPEVKYLVLGAVCMFFSAIFDGVTLGMIVPVTDKIFTNKQIILPEGMPEFIVNLAQRVNSFQPGYLLNILIFFLPFLFLAKGIMFFAQGYLMDMVSQRTMMNVRNSLYRKLQGLSLDFYSYKRQGELMSRVTNDVNLIGHALSYGLTDLIYQSLQVLIFSSIVFLINKQLFLMSLFIFPVMGLLIYSIGKKLKRFSVFSQEKMADLNTILAESIQGVRIIKAFRREAYEAKKFREVNYSYYKYAMKVIKRTLVMSPLTEFIGVIGAVVIVYFGGKQVMQDQLSFGVFALFLGALLSMIRPFKKLSKVHAINQKAVAGSKRIYAILDMAPLVVEKEGAKPLNSCVQKIEYQDVWFQYKKQEEFVLKGIDFEAKRGDIVAVVGPTGAGKTTLLNFLPRFYDPTRGKILFDGRDLRDIKISSLRDKIGLVTQDMILFNDTVRNNIAYGNLEASFKDIESASEKALAYDFIKKMPKGFDTFIGERGFRLSGGEKQRLCIARAILKNPEILILDEATSQLDSASEDLVQKALNNLMQARTVFVIAHRLSTVKHATKILVMQDNRVVEQGTHQELMQISDLYKKLYQLQFNL